MALRLFGWRQWRQLMRCKQWKLLQMRLLLLQVLLLL
jgi:hypothetical protein